jgi:hypothetical protein
MEEFINSLKISADSAAVDGQTAIKAAELVIQLNEACVEFDAQLCGNLVELIKRQQSDRLVTICLGTLWREDCLWLAKNDDNGISFREHLLEYVASSIPTALSPDFWLAVSGRGQSFVAIAYAATKGAYPLVAAELLVKRCQAALHDPFLMDIGGEVRSFINSADVAARDAFLNHVKSLPQAEKRKLMTHLDISLMAELDENAIEHKGQDFYYDEEAERKKREDKGDDIFSEVARRLKNGEKPS